MRAVVYHAFYGCDTGCCGHIVELEQGQSEFRFSHPYGDYRDYAESLVREVFGAEHVADLDWENCLVLED